MRNSLLILPFLIFVVFVGFAFLGMKREDPDSLPSELMGKYAPEVQLQPLDGITPFTQSDLENGSVTFVNFWASWCAPCRAEHPTLMWLSEQGISVFGVNYKDSPINANQFLQDLGNPFSMGGADPKAAMGLDWGVYGLPETFVIGPDGKVLLRVAGPLTQRNMKTRVLPALKAVGISFP